MVRYNRTAKNKRELKRLLMEAGELMEEMNLMMFCGTETSIIKVESYNNMERRGALAQSATVLSLSKFIRSDGGDPW